MVFDMNNMERRQKAFPPLEKCCNNKIETDDLAHQAVSQFILNAWSKTGMDKDWDKVAEAKASYDSHLESVIEVLNEEDQDEAYDMLESLVLSLDQSRTFDICFGTGGPAYHLIVNTSSGPNPEITGMSFEYHDWFYKKVFPIVCGTPDWNVWYDFVMTYYDPIEIGDLL
jgi:hypothetical protein|tara:strand:- start:1383 stop:1892 length:510 start_codon:yes stop_codon:yes gene_type:complete